jgi:galacturan 1,4-alpha-galacturonidase
MDITNINFHDSPAWFTFFVDSKDIIIDRSTFVAHSTGSRPKNSDGFDSYNVDGVRITNCMMDVDDDCISPKANTTNLLVENVHCKGSHGISMGSIGQYPGTLDYITNVRIANVTLVDGTIGVRLKAWAGENVGYGYMRNITYQDINVENVDEPIVLDQCYFNVKDADCQKFPSKVDLEDIHFINITGSSSGKKGNVVGTMRCSPEAECKNIELKNIDLKNGANETDKPIIKCDGIKGMAPGSCVETQPKTGGKPTSKPATKTDKSGQEKSFFANQGLLYVLLPFGMWLALFW